MEHRLQCGLVFGPETTPLPCYRLLLFDVAADTRPARLADALAQLVTMLDELAAGQVRDLTGQPGQDAVRSRAQFESLRLLLGYGRRLFDGDLHDPPLIVGERPEHLSYLPREPAGFPELPWSNGVQRNLGEADVAVQLLASSEAAVNCAAVECWKLIEDEDLPLSVVATFSGFGRPDGRGWLEFHDGVSNIESSQRLRALEARPDPPWMGGGTYMAFLRLAVDLRGWRRLERPEQELVVGRDKLSGAALARVERDSEGRLVPVPAPIPDSPSKVELAEWRDPPQTTDALVEASHIHRANQNRASSSAPGGLRLFRQGYDFLDGFRAGAPTVGLNFVSFQSDLRTLHQILHLPGWLGDVNFGGPSERSPGAPPSPQLLELLAGGLYAVPPREEPFPGAALFSAA